MLDKTDLTENANVRYMYLEKESPIFFCEILSSSNISLFNYNYGRCKKNMFLTYTISMMVLPELATFDNQLYY